MAKIIKKKFFEVDVPMIGEKHSILAGALEEINKKVMRIDVTRKLKGKSLDMIFKIVVENGKAIGIPVKMTLMPFFVKHMMHTGVDYVEDSIMAETKDSQVVIKPFLITRKRVSRAVRRTLRNSARNWLVDYLKTKTDDDVFQDVLSNQLQKPLSLKLKKIYPLAICEIKSFEIKKPLTTKSASTEIGQIEIKKDITEGENFKEETEEITEKVEISEEKPKKKTKNKGIK